MQPEECQQLFADAQAGDLEAFTALVNPIKTRLLASIHLRLPPPSRRTVEPDDVLQDTLLQALESLPSLSWRGQRAFESWLMTVARNRVHRSYKQRPDPDPSKPMDELVVDDDGTTPVRRMRQEERFARLQQALEELSPTHREVVMLARIEGLRIQEIAERMDKTPAATSMLLLRGLRALRNAFGETESLSLPSRSLSRNDQDQVR